MSSTVFPLAEVQQLRKQATKAREVTDFVPEEWSKSTVDPMAVLAVFQPLRIKQGCILRAYQFREAADGKGVVWAMPADADFPVPGACARQENVLAGPPKPMAALDEAMEAIEGDGSPISYLCASLLSRELREFGAMLHGCNWSTHTILGQNPLTAGNALQLLNSPSGTPDQWKWLTPEPVEWQPHVHENDRAVTVTFFTFSGLGQQTIYRHSDTFQPGIYSFTTQAEEIAKGPRGYWF